MFKTYRVLRNPDVNTDSASSTEQQSATVQDVNPGASSAPAVKDEDLTAEQIRDKVIAEVSAPKAEDKPASVEPPVAEGKEEPEVKVDEELPFGKHPRWIERQKELETLRPLKEEVERLRPLSENARQLEQYRTKNDIDDQTFADALTLAAEFKKDPKAVRARLQQVIQNIDLATGATLPVDLQAQVDSGAMPKQYADELARSRMQLQQVGQSTQQMQVQVAQSQEQQINGTFAVWDNAKRQVDPDFQPKKDASVPDGKWEMVNNKLIALKTMNPPKNQQEAVALVERAYSETNASLARYIPKPTAQKNLSSKNSSSTGKAKFQTVREAALAVARGEKVSPEQIMGY